MTRDCESTNCMVVGMVRTYLKLDGLDAPICIFVAFYFLFVFNKIDPYISSYFEIFVC